MFSYDVRIRGEKAYYSMGLSFRIVCALFFVFLLVGLVLTIQGEGLSFSLLIPFFIMLILLLSLLYRDEWVFDNGKKEAVMIFGLACFIKRRTIPYSDIKWIEVTHFLKGIEEGSELVKKPSWKHPEQIVLSVRLNDEETKYDLEIMSDKKSGGKVDRNASYLSSFTGLALHFDKVRDTGRTLRR